MAQLTDKKNPSFLISRPPRLDQVEIPLDPCPTEEEIPYTNPVCPWDRLTISAKRIERPRWDEETPRLDLPLPPEAPDGSCFAGPILLLAVEILLGQRHCNVLRHWLVPGVFGPLSRRAGLGIRIHGKATPKGKPRILKIIKDHPLPRVLEIVAAIHDGERVRAAGMRMEFIRGHWRTVALEIG